MKKIIVYNGHLAPNRVVICGMFNPETKQLGIGLATSPRKTYIKKFHRAMAEGRAARRPLLWPCESLDAAYKLIKSMFPLLCHSVIFDPNANFTMAERVHPSPAEAKIMVLAEKAESIIEDACVVPAIAVEEHIEELATA